MLHEITPVLLTLDEAPNLERVLARLSWAREVVLVDSGSRDGTLDIARSAGNVRVVHRDFDEHARQWNHAVHETAIESEWVLALDADYVLDESLLQALRDLRPPDGVNAYRARFVYCIDGRPLRGSLYPPREVLFRRARGRFVQDGHTQRLRVDGTVMDLSGFIRHDDRKPMARWLRSQWRYAKLEAERIDGAPWRSLSWSGRIRTLILPAAPLAMLWCLVVRGTLRDGAPGVFYSLQRGVAEALIALALLRRRMRSASPEAADDG